jgi:hypothetical protein
LIKVIIVIMLKSEVCHGHIHHNVAKEESLEILITFFGVHNSISAAMASVNIGARRPFNIGMLRLHETIAFRANTLSRGPVEHSVVGGIGSDNGEHFLQRKVRNGIGALFKSLWVGLSTFLRLRGQIFPHALIALSNRLAPWSAMLGGYQRTLSP